MKRAIILILAVTTILFISSCGAEPSPADDVDRLIEAIGYVDLSKENAVKTAEDAYAALSDADKAQVLKYSQLVAARKALENKKDAQSAPSYDSLTGEWAELKLKDIFSGTISFQDAGFTNPSTAFELDSKGVALSADGLSGEWKCNGDELTFEWKNTEGVSTYKLEECAGKQVLCENNERLYIKKADIPSFISEVFVKVQLNPDNASTYLIIKQHTCDALDEFGDPYGKRAVTTLTSGAYPNGLVFCSSSGFAAAILNPVGNSAATDINPFAYVLSIYPELSTLGNVTGTLYFIKSQYANCTFVLNDGSLNSYHRQISLFGGLLTLNDASPSFKGIGPTPEMLY